MEERIEDLFVYFINGNNKMFIQEYNLLEKIFEGKENFLEKYFGKIEIMKFLLKI